MSRELKTTGTSEGQPPIFAMQEAVNIWRVPFNIAAVFLSNLLPMRAKRWLLRRTGMEVEQGAMVSITGGLDFVTPGNVKLGKNCVIGYGSTVLGHEMTPEEFREGKTVIGENVLIGANTTVLPGVEIGDGAKVSAHSLVNRDVEPGEFVGGVPIENLEESE